MNAVRGDFARVKEGDHVRRIIDGTISMEITVTKVTTDYIFCGKKQFDRRTGLEIDHDIQWGPQYGYAGSFLQEKEAS